MGVQVLSCKSENRREYTQEAMQKALAAYEGAKVNVNHPDNPRAMRGVQDRFGVLENVRIESGAVKADLKYNPKHPLSETIKWWAENRPDAIGLSHNAVGQGKDRNGVFVVENILKVRSVDIVADPATAKSLYEAMMDTDTLAGAGGTDTGGDDYAAHLGNAVVAILKDEGLDLAAKRKKVLAALKLLDDGDSGKSDGGSDGKSDSDARESLEAVVNQLKAELDAYKVKDQLAARSAKVKQLCTEAKLPEFAVTEVFLEQLVSSKDDAAAKSLIADRKILIGVKSPRSAGAGAASANGSISTKDFAKQIKGA